MTGGWQKVIVLLYMNLTYVLLGCDQNSCCEQDDESGLGETGE